MRFLYVLRNDIRYQIKYGFYLLYALISVIYIALMFMAPTEYKETAASIIVLTDPAMLGMFFIGGIWLLEKEEGLHRFWKVSPVKALEYIVSKAISLSIISTLSAVLIISIGLNNPAHYLLLSVGVFIGSLIFTILGLVVASYALSVNNYILIGTPVAIFISTPPILVSFGISNTILEILPGTALWRIISFSIGMTDNIRMQSWFILALWLAIAVLIASCRIPTALQTEGGEKV